LELKEIPWLSLAINALWTRGALVRKNIGSIEGTRFIACLAGQRARNRVRYCKGPNHWLQEEVCSGLESIIIFSTNRLTCRQALSFTCYSHNLYLINCSYLVKRLPQKEGLFSKAANHLV
jgi:hypothetical protein